MESCGAVGHRRPGALTLARAECPVTVTAEAGLRHAIGLWHAPWRMPERAYNVGAAKASVRAIATIEVSREAPDGDFDEAAAADSRTIVRVLRVEARE